MKTNGIQNRDAYSGYALIYTCKVNNKKLMCKIKW